MLTSKVKTCGPARCYRLCGKDSLNRLIVKGEFLAAHFAFVVLINHLTKDVVEHIRVGHCRGEYVTYVVQRIDSNAETEDPNLSRSGL